MEKCKLLEEQRFQSTLSVHNSSLSAIEEQMQALQVRMDEENARRQEEWKALLQQQEKPTGFWSRISRRGTSVRSRSRQAGEYTESEREPSTARSHDPSTYNEELVQVPPEPPHGASPFRK